MTQNAALVMKFSLSNKKKRRRTRRKTKMPTKILKTVVENQLMHN